MTEIGDYGFAKTDEKRNLFIFAGRREKYARERRRLCGELVEEVHLPSQVWGDRSGMPFTSAPG